MIYLAKLLLFCQKKDIVKFFIVSLAWDAIVWLMQLYNEIRLKYIG